MNTIKKMLGLMGLLGLMAGVGMLEARGQVLPTDLGSGLSNVVSQIDERTNLYTVGEVEFRVGGVYVQTTGEAGTLLAAEKWDIFGLNNFGIGAESITSGNKQAAEFAYLSYRHPLGNVCGSVFAGAGYSDLDKCLLGVAGARAELRLNSHIGSWVSGSYGFEAKNTNSRGLLIGAGVSYAF